MGYKLIEDSKRYQRKYYQEHKEQRKAYRAIWYEANKRSTLELQKIYAEKNKEAIIIKRREYYLKNRTTIDVKRKEYRLKHPDRCKKRLRESYYKHKDSRLAKAKRFRDKRKYAVLLKYSASDTPACCWDGCDINDLDMLTIDHTNNDGAAHRKAMVDSSKLYYWIVKNNYPSGFQVLCANHNLKKELERKRRTEVR